MTPIYFPGDLTVRIWDIETNDNYTLPINLKQYLPPERSQQISENFTSICYSKVNQTLSAGTNVGRVYFWVKKSNAKDFVDNPEDSWELCNISTVSGTIKQLTWGSANFRSPLLSINCVTKVYIMKEQNMCTCYSPKIWATQKSATQVLIESFDVKHLLNLPMQVSDMCCDENYFACTNGRSVAIYEVRRTMDIKLKEGNPKLNCELVGTVQCDNESILIYNKSLISLYVTGVFIKSFNGLVLASFPVVMAEGEPIGMYNIAIYNIKKCFSC